MDKFEVLIVKSVIVFAIAVIFGVFVAIGFEHYSNNQCRIAAIQQNIPTDSINKVCDK